MTHWFKKIMSLRDIKYGWLLVASVIIFLATLYLDFFYNPSHVPIVALAGYGLAFVVAATWGAINYMGHIRVNVMYQKNNNIQAFIEKLVINQDEKLELQGYLEDYKQDLISQGKSQEEAAEIAIDRFKVKEFTSLSKNTRLFDMHGHYYLWGYTGIAILLFLITLLVVNVVQSSLLLIVIEATSFAYGLGFFGLFFVYRMMDAILYSKM